MPFNYFESFLPRLKEDISSQTCPVLLDNSCFPFSDFFEEIYPWRCYSAVDIPLVKRVTEIVQNFPRQGFYLTKEVFAEASRAQLLIGEKLKYLNKQELRLSNHHIKVSEEASEAKVLFDDLGLLAEKFFRELRPRQLSFENHAYSSLYKLLELSIQEFRLKKPKPKEIFGHPPSRYSRFGDLKGDESLVASALYFSLIEEKPVSLFTADTDIVTFLFVPLNSLVCPPFHPENSLLHANLYRHAITLYFFNYRQGTSDVKTTKKLLPSDNPFPSNADHRSFISQAKKLLRQASRYAGKRQNSEL